ncbi:MAG: type IV secretory system conjugative DNA transfer family protein [Bacilli bacterium]|nr:type IV secretory system conjugative DNA transfer family protein [Bacilli bacterium]
MLIKKTINYIIISICAFILSCNVCYNLTTIIKNNIKLSWDINIIHSLFQLKDISLLFGTILMASLIMLFVLKYDKELKLKLQKLKKMPEEDGSFEYGSSRWATKKEIKKQFKVWDIGSPLKSGGIPVTMMDGKYYYSDSFDHTLIIGSTGSGKTICEIMPLIFNLGYAGESMVVNDVKGELYSHTSDFLKKQGYKIKVINLRDALSSDGWNPLHLPYKYYKDGNIDLAGDLIENFSKSLTKNLSSKDMYWEKSANAVLTALCYAIIEDAPKEEQVHLFSIYNMLVEHGAKTIDRFNSLDLYFQQKTFGNLAKMSYATGSFAKGETRATLFSVLATVIKIFSDTGIANLTSRTDFELDSIGMEKTAVFLIIPDEKESRHELATLFVDQCYQALVNTAQSLPSGKMPIRVNFVCDEFSSMPPMNMSHKIQVARSRNIRFYLVLQDFDQLKETYKEQAGTIKSNCTNWIYLLTADNETAREISSRLGKYTISSERVSTSSRLEQLDYNISNDKSLMGRELMMPDELMRFQFGEAIFMGTRMHPIKATIVPISKYPIKYKIVNLPNTPREYQIECFNLDEFRKNKTINNMNKVELE